MIARSALMARAPADAPPVGGNPSESGDTAVGAGEVVVGSVDIGGGVVVVVMG